MTTDTTGRKPGNGNEKHVNTARKAAELTAEDVQDDFRSLQEDVAKLTQQLAKFAAAKGGQAMDDMVGNAQAKGRQVADAVGEARDNLTNAIDEQLEQRPYTTLALALAMGFVAGAIWKR